jgi:citrate lyase alpha subunit
MAVLHLERDNISNVVTCIIDGNSVEVLVMLASGLKDNNGFRDYVYSAIAANLEVFNISETELLQQIHAAKKKMFPKSG